MRNEIKALGLCLLWIAQPMPATAAEGPQMKPGLWEVTSTFEAPSRRKPGQAMAMTMQHCVGEKMDTGLWDPSRAPFGPQAGAGERKCAPPKHSREGNAFLMETECQGREGTVKARTKTTVQDDRFDSEMVFNYDPPYKGRSSSTMKMTGKHLGACPADLKPGAVRMTGMPVPGAVPPTAR